MLKKKYVGVAQGSLISLYLFNVYVEDLLIKLENEEWSIRDLYDYADDHLIVNGSPTQLDRAIMLGREWSIEYTDLHKNIGTDLLKF